MSPTPILPPTFDPWPVRTDMMRIFAAGAPIIGLPDRLPTAPRIVTPRRTAAIGWGVLLLLLLAITMAVTRLRHGDVAVEARRPSAATAAPVARPMKPVAVPAPRVTVAAQPVPSRPRAAPESQATPRLTGDALAQALAEDALITRRLNQASLARAGPPAE